MAMTRKNYRNFAESIDSALKAYDHPEAKSAVAFAARQIADDCKSDNPNFRYDTFFKACGLDGFGYPESETHV